MHVLIDKAHETCTNDFLTIELASFHQPEYNIHAIQVTTNISCYIMLIIKSTNQGCLYRKP